MKKLNPLHIARIKAGVDVCDLDLTKGTGQTTAVALELLAKAIRSPNVAVSKDSDSPLSERKAVVERALYLAFTAGLRHIYQTDTRAHEHGTAIIFEWREPDKKPKAKDPVIKRDAPKSAAPDYVQPKPDDWEEN